MADVVEMFGRAIDALAARDPDQGRRLMLTGLRLFGLKLRHLPDRRLPPSRQYSAALINRTVCRMLAHPEQAALVSVFQPCELLEAMDVIPMCAELFSAFVNGCGAESAFAQAAEVEGIAETYCSYHKVLLGSAFSGLLPAPKLIVNTSLVCDANNLTFRTLAEHYDVPRFYVDVPPRQDETALRYVAEQLLALQGFLEEQLGRSMQEERLREAVARSGRTVAALRACIPEKREHSLPGDLTSEMYEIYLSHNALGSSQAERYAAMLLDDLKAAPRARGIRLLWLHTIPIWQTPVKALFDLNDRYQVIACDMCMESLCEVDPERPYESMARRLVFSPWNGGQVRVDSSVRLAKALGADGVICFCHWGCKQTMGLSAVLKNELEKAGFPTLILNGDGCDRRNASDGQTATRLNAFLEMLEGQGHG
ncbi:MAG: 2-hydroxyacyl-CoA dehydratase [Clostridia bacterium]|nr:2-hydroxyacyl-CoA dehydratase [Clostridia bacterium]